jgi:hypothetical protein
MAKVVVFGSGQWAELAHFYLTHDSPHQVAAFTLDRNYLKEDRFMDLGVVTFDDLERNYPPDEYAIFIPLSFKKMNHIRAEKYNDAKRRGYKFVNYVSSKATLWPGLHVVKTVLSWRTIRFNHSCRSATMSSCGAVITSVITQRLRIM